MNVLHLWPIWLKFRDTVQYLANSNRLDKRGRVKFLAALKQLSNWANNEHKLQVQKLFWLSVSENRTWDESQIKMLGTMASGIHREKQVWLVELPAPELTEYLGCLSLWLVGIGDFKTPLHHFFESSHSKIWATYGIPVFGSQVRSREAVLLLPSYDFKFLSY